MSTNPVIPGPVVMQAPDEQVYRFPDEAAAADFAQKVKDAGGEVTRLEPAAPPVPIIARTLYDLETHFAALLETEPDALPAELEQEYELEMRTTLTDLVEKRDRVGQFRQHLVSQIALAKSERKRLEDREGFYQRALDKLDGYLTRIIDGLGLDPKGKRKKLEGRVITLALHGCKQRVDVKDEVAIPTRYKRVTVTLPAETWELVVDSLDLDVRAQVLDSVSKPKIEVDRTLVYTDLAAEVSIPGCQLGGGTYVEIK